jgi:pimeloyl-ACP methyl ester carboxylesterase
VRPKVAVRVGEATEGAKPLIFFHGDWTRGGFYVEHLARKLGSQFSLIAVAPHGPGGERIPSSIEEMAADRLPAILEAQPTGPYRLAGHCVGGIVALETARLLMRQNQGVESLVMIDSPVMIGGEVARSRPGAPDGGDGSSVAESEGTPIRPQTPEIDWGIEPYSERLAIYSPAPLPLPLRLLVISAEYDGRGWVRLSDNAALQEIYGYHFDLVTRRIDDLARRMRSWLTSEAPPHSAERRTAAMSAGTNDKEIPHPPIDAAKHESLSRRLGRFFGYGRR